MAKKPSLYRALRDHFGADPAQLPVLEQSYAFYERANVHLAIDDISESADSPPTLTGIVLTDDYSVTLAQLSRPATAEY